MKHTIFILLISFCWTITVNAQTKINLDPLVKGNKFGGYLSERFQEEFPKSLSNLGLSGICYVKFVINEIGNPKNIEFSPDTNEPLAVFINAVLLESNGAWKDSLSNELYVGEYLVLPISYNLQKNGKTEDANSRCADLPSFFSDIRSDKASRTIFLKPVDLTSPFDYDGNNFKRLKLKKNL